MDPFSPVNAVQQEHAKNMLAEIHQQFIEVVKQGRGKRLKESPDIFSGLIWTGQKSIELAWRMAWAIWKAWRAIVIKAEDIVDFTTHEGIAERLAKRFGAGMASAFPGLSTQAGIKLR